MNKELEWKETNPKDAIGDKKLALHLVPSTLISWAAVAYTEGGLKYGKYNWRASGVRVSIYIDALKRHIEAYQNGEWADPDTRVPHLASVLACAGIILDAKLVGKLVDDRPPAAPVKSLIDNEQTEIVRHLKEIFEDYDPHQWTIEDEIEEWVP